MSRQAEESNFSTISNEMSLGDRKSNTVFNGSGEGGWENQEKNKERTISYVNCEAVSPRPPKALQPGRILLYACTHCRSSTLRTVTYITATQTL